MNKCSSCNTQLHILTVHWLVGEKGIYCEDCANHKTRLLELNKQEPITIYISNQKELDEIKNNKLINILSIGMSSETEIIVEYEYK